MKTRWIRIFFPCIAACFVVAFLYLFAHIFSPYTFGGQNFLQDAQPETVWAMRMITSFYGIDSPLLISNQGQQVLVTGHGACLSEDDAYALSATVTQTSGGAKGKGRADGECHGEANFTWSLVAEADGPKEYEPGAAQVCAQVVIHTDGGGAIVQKWCKDVILEEEGQRP